MKTALITGASGGIGLEFAKLLAQKGFNLILVARSGDRLAEISHDLKASNNTIDVKYYAKDLSVVDNAQFIFEDIKKQEIAVDYLINNAGFGIDGQFTEIPWEREQEMLNLNMITLSYFTKVFAKDMLSRGFGRILNLGSTGSFQPAPYLAGYCATKAFVLSLSEAVNYELKGTNVRVSTLCPGVTDTKFHEVAGTNNTMLDKMLPHATADKVARYGLKLMEKGTAVGVHGLMNRIFVFSNRFSSRSMITAFAGKLMKK
jgi:uncharacterized protein